MVYYHHLVLLGRNRVCAVLVLTLLALLAPTTTPTMAQMPAAAANLLVNGDFERGSASWDPCGDAALADKQQPGATGAMVFGGRYAARVSYSDAGLCGDDSFYDPHGQLAQSFTVPGAAEALTISFRYSRVGQVRKPLRVTLGTETGLLGRVVESDQVDPGELGGWNLYRSELSADEVARVRGQTLSLYLSVSAWSSSGASPGSDTDPQGYYIDDVRVAAASERTPEAPLPAALKGDGTRPLVYVNSDLGTARMNADGSSAQTIMTEATKDTIFPTWSSNGTRISLLKSWVTEEGNGDLRVNPALITILLVTDANGQSPRELYRTAGLPGYHPIPYDPVNPEKAALDVEIKALDWSPDDRSLALSICATQRYYSGAVNDSICFVEVRDIATGNLLYKGDRLYRASWGSNNLLLAETLDGYDNRQSGIWQVDMNANPPTETLVVPGADLIALREDRFPTWSPDGAHFVTARRVAGYHYYDDGSTNYHRAIMLFDKGNPVGRTLMLADQGDTPANFTWSPDGKYVLYSLNQGDASDVWWLEAATGATGKVTNDGKSIGANWRPTCRTNCTTTNISRVFLPLIRR